MEQYGTELFTRTHWDPDEFEKYRQRLKRHRPQLKTEIDAKVRRIETIIQSYDPFFLLLSVSTENCIGPADKWSRGTSETNICYAEYAQSLILAQEQLTFDQEPSKEVVDEFKSLIKSLFHDVWMYFGFEMAEDAADKNKSYLRFLSILQYLFVRGDSIPQHHTDLMTDLFSPHDIFFKTHYGFSASEILSAEAEIERQLEQDFNRYVELQTGASEALEKFKDFIQSYDGDTSTGLDEILEAFLGVPEVSSHQRSLKDLHASIKEQPFSIEPNEAVPAELLKQVSAALGDNRHFSTFQKAPGWPTNDSVVHSRPLIEHCGTYYCFVPQLLFYNIGRILEQWIQEKDKGYFETTYQDMRGKYIETKALEYLGKILPGAQVFGQLYYRVTEDGVEKRVETDGLILYDRNLIIIETKAGSLHVAARRGGLKKMEKDCREILEGAYQQARRTLSYIRGTNEPKFEFKNGEEALVIKNKEEICDFWMINVSAENLGHLAAQLNSLRALNLMQVSEWPWSVFVNDLRVIAELIEFPSELFHYLQKRTRLNEFPQFSSSDELEIFMFYLHKGLHFDEEKLAKLDMFLPTGFTEDLDRYYNYLLGIGTEASKPTLSISEPLKHFIMAVEATGKPYRTRIVNALLNFNKPGQDDTIEKLVEFAERCRERGEFDDFSVRNMQANAAMTFFFYPRYDAGKLQNMRRHSQLLKYHYKLDEYTLFTIDVSKQAWTGLDFETFNHRWTYDRDMQEMVKSLQMWRVRRELQSHGKIERNSPCPCGSGKKYKKCCGQAN
jgi:hypothetical protein